MAYDQPLAGRVIGITAERRAEDQAVLFRRLGAEVVHAPTIHTSLIADPEVLRSTTEQLVADPPDYLIANTGLGIRAWIEAATGWGLDVALVEAMQSVRIAARGPKAAGAVSLSKLRVWWRAPTEQLAELADHLLEEGVAGKRVAFQLHGDDGSELTSRLEDAGATVIPIPVYRWSVPGGESGRAVLELIERSCAGGIDAVTFTAGQQVRNLFALAESFGRASEMLEAFGRRRPMGACIGPVCAGVAKEEGISDPVVPDNWRLGSLVKAVSAALRELA